MGLFDPQGLPSSPTSQTNTSSGIASWAQPYVMNYLNQGNALLNQGPTAMQNQVYGSASNMQTPGQFAQGTNFLNQSGAGMLSTTGTALDYGQQGSNYGQQGAGYGQQATGVGQAYQNMATDPSQMAAYMNPYVQQALNPQLALLNQQQALAGQGIASKAAGQGAFGGNRATLAQGLNQQNYALAQQQAIGQGYSDAFKQAQQAQQFGADLGLRGLQTGIQGAQTGIQGAQTGLQGVQGAQAGYAGATQAGVGLGNIGSQQGQYETNKLALQNQIANQQYNLPFQRLQFMQGLMQGLPVASQTQTGYQSGPNSLSQIGGLGTTLIGGAALANKFGVFDFLKNSGGSGTLGNVLDDDGNPMPPFAKGGQIKSYASGGMAEGLAAGLDYGNEMRPMGQIAPSGYGLAELMQARDVIPMGAGIYPAFGGSNEDYVNSLYQNMLGRQADQGGYQHNLDLLNSGKVSAQDLAGAFRASEEGQRMPSRNVLMGAGMPAASGLADIRLNQLLG
jgi:hypothetical protein